MDVETIHLDQQLVERLFAFVVPTTEPGPAVASNGIDLVDEDDCWRVGLGLLEEVANTGRANADEHLDEV